MQANLKAYLRNLSEAFAEIYKRHLADSAVFLKKLFLKDFISILAVSEDCISILAVSEGFTFGVCRAFRVTWKKEL